jgi:hypothetical protein
MPIPKAAGKDQHGVTCGEGTSLDLERRLRKMLWTVAVILLVLWALGLVTSYTMGGFIHILLVIAIVVVLINVIQGRKAL